MVGIFTFLGVVWDAFDIWSNLEFIGQKSGLIWDVIYLLFATQTGARIILVVFAGLFVVSLLFQVQRARPALTESSITALALPEPASPDVNLHAECEKTIARLRDSEILYFKRAEADAGALEALKAKYADAVEIANQQASTKIAERKALIASWRTLVETATREYWDTGDRSFRFPRILESQEGYTTLSPLLPAETKIALHNARQGEHSDISNLVEMLADDIAQIERDWQM